MVFGGITGWLAPVFAGKLAPIGKIFINMMFCIVVPLVFASISSSVAGMKSKKPVGKILGTTIGIFVITGTIASVIMFILMKVFPPEFLDIFGIFTYHPTPTTSLSYA